MSFWRGMSAGLLFASLLPAQVVIRGALVADGTGRALRRADVRVIGSLIAQVGEIRAQPGDQVVEGQGLVLAPGFIDLHNHSTAGLEQEPAAASQIAQGITTVVLGQDGSSPLPIADWLQARRTHAAALNLLTLVGHATVRTRVMGDDYKRAATPGEIAAMAALVEQGMRDGAIGLSTGLEYEVGSYSTTAEVVALAQAAARHGGIYVSHLRDEADRTFEALQEILTIGEQAKLPVHISHIKLGSAAVWHRAPEAIRLITAARQRGLDVTADCYPYDAWSSTIKVLVPDKQYDNPTSVAKALADVGGAANITITSCPAHRPYEFHTLAELAATEKKTAVDLFIRIVKDGGAGVVCHAMQDDDIKAFYQQPWVMVGSDGGIGMRHPRGAGTYPRVLGLFVRERRWLTLPAAIHQMTQAPAQRLKLTNRGVIQPGFAADLVLFNPARVIDRATFQAPLALATGIAQVWVNGQVVWAAGKTTGTLPGAVLTR